MENTKGTLTPAARMLVVNQFGLCLGFYMVLPFLATYLRDDLGFAAALVGTVLGIRTLCQQGLYILGGTAADRVDPRALIMLGCGLRVVSFGLLATVTSPAGIIAATALTGVAGAIFSPAVETYLMHESPGRRAETFTLLNLWGNAGTLLGPVIGALLLGVDFRIVAATACVIFGVLTVAQALVLPGVQRPAPEHGVLQAWRRVFTNRRFLGFTLAGAAYFALFNQLYLALPLEAQRVTGHPAAVSAVFIVSTVVGLIAGVRLTKACKRRWSTGTSMSLGLALIGAGFLPIAAAAPLTASAGEPLPLTSALMAGMPALLGTAVFSVGITIANPFMMELIPAVGSERLVGTYYGFFYLVSSLLAAVISTVTGSLLDLGPAGLRWAPFALLAAVGAAGALGIAAMQRRGALTAPAAVALAR
ncbi:MFS transporter [Actinoplanes sp. CA-131856]